MSLENVPLLVFRKFFRGYRMLIEKVNGLDFTKGMSLQELGLSEEVANYYAASASYDLQKIMQDFEIRPTDEIVDLGCGKGAAMYEFSKLNFRFVGGVEISKRLCEIAESNFRKLGISNIEVFQSDATIFKKLDRYNYFYLFNSFPDQILKLVLDNIEASFYQKPRDIIFIYYNINPEKIKVIDEQGFFINPKLFKGSKHDAFFFEKKIPE